ncbi:uncharacterized protein BJX67DRAFT_128658 [Aspergillus lucknowensis]|uniref:Uncharacterized protein n=1 Tax=Aspergillus lucknowensis TaxID=176173 RepID=A0ABR4LQR6_9EURO
MSHFPQTLQTAQYSPDFLCLFSCYIDLLITDLGYSARAYLGLLLTGAGGFWSTILRASKADFSQSVNGQFPGTAQPCLNSHTAELIDTVYSE